MSLRTLSPGAARTLEAVAARLVPDAAGVAAEVDAILSDAPWIAGLGVSLMLFAIEWLPLGGGLGRFTRKDAKGQDATLAALHGSRLYVVRNMLKVLRALTYMAYYGRSDVQHALGVRREEWVADRRAARRARVGAGEPVP